MSTAPKKNKRRLRAAPDPQGTTASKLADQKAKAFIQQQKLIEQLNKEAAALMPSPGEAALFQQFGQRIQPGGILQHLQPKPGPVSPPPRLTGGPDFEEFVTKVMQMQAAPPAKPVNTKRNWGELFRNVTDGVYRAAQRANDGMTFAGTRHDLHPDESEYPYSDATGEHTAPIHRLSISEDELRRSDEAVGRILDAAVTKTLVQDVCRLMKDSPFADEAMNLEEHLTVIAGEHALYPAIHLSKKLREVPDKAGRIAYVLGYAVAWMYEPGLDEDDDDEEGD